MKVNSSDKTEVIWVSIKARSSLVDQGLEISPVVGEVTPTNPPLKSQVHSLGALPDAAVTLEHQ